MSASQWDALNGITLAHTIVPIPPTSKLPIDTDTSRIMATLAEPDSSRRLHAIVPYPSKRELLRDCRANTCASRTTSTFMDSQSSDFHEADQRYGQ
jgi:hypothetical protein